jgi:hypothetical protein
MRQETPESAGSKYCPFSFAGVHVYCYTMECMAWMDMSYWDDEEDKLIERGFCQMLEKGGCNGNK